MNQNREGSGRGGVGVSQFRIYKELKARDPRNL